MPRGFQDQHDVLEENDEQIKTTKEAKGGQGLHGTVVAVTMCPVTAVPAGKQILIN